MKVKRMKPRILFPSLLLGLAGANPAIARDDLCFVPIANWQPRNVIIEQAEAQGWKVRWIKTDHGCYEIKGRDERGFRFEVLVNPQTLEVIKIEYDNKNEDWRHKEHKGD